ncbi:MAG: DEAD/DEAH box helicase, partial [Promethearchaeota archaeon]
MDSLGTHDHVTGTPAPSNPAIEGFPKYLKEHLERKGVDELFPIQEEAVAAGILEGNSMIVSAPSGSGKTLVAEMATLRILSTTRKKVLYLVPLRAIASEKNADFRTYFPVPPEQVVPAFGDQDVKLDVLKAARVVVATYEKFDSYLRNSRRIHQWINKVGLVVVDEIHNIHDPKRGPRLESVIIRACSRLKHLQVLGLTGTIANPGELAEWISRILQGGSCVLVSDKHRPVDLSYRFTVTSDKNRHLKTIVKAQVSRGSQVLVFCRSRRETEMTARAIASTCAVFQTASDQAELDRVVRVMWERGGRDLELESVFSSGVGFHHAGLTNQEREIVEELFRRQVLKVLCCTTTLESGINTPADVVVIKDVLQYRKNGEDFQRVPLDLHQFHQICGRAGRPGLSTKGVAHVLFGNHDEQSWFIENYFENDPNRLIPKHVRVTSKLLQPESILEQILAQIDDDRSCTLDEMGSIVENSLAFPGQQKRGKFVPLSAPFSSKVLKQFSSGLQEELTPDDTGEFILLKEVETTRDFLDFRVKLDGDEREYYCGFNFAEGWYCECDLFQGGVTESFLLSGRPHLDDIRLSVSRTQFCPHLKRLLRTLNGKKYEKYFPDAVRRYLKRVSAVQYLLDTEFIELDSRSRVRKTIWGILCTRHYIPPPTLNALRQEVNNLGEIVTEKELFDLFNHHLGSEDATLHGLKLAEVLDLLSAGTTDPKSWKLTSRSRFYLGDVERILEKFDRFFSLLEDV